MKKHLKYLLLYALWILGIIYILGGCQAGKSVVHPEDEQALEQLVNAKRIRVKAEWARPLTTTGMASVVNAGLLPPGNNAARINLINTPNTFEIKGDSVFVDLPYFGERQIVSTYPGGQGINFEGEMENYKVKRSAKDSSYRITFDASDKTERFDISVHLFPGQRAVLTFYSSQRNTIRYDGITDNPQAE